MGGKEREDRHLAVFEILFKDCVRRRWPRLNSNQIQVAWSRIVEHKSLPEIAQEMGRALSTVRQKDAVMRHAIGFDDIERCALAVFAELGRFVRPFVAGLDPEDPPLDSARQG